MRKRDKNDRKIEPWRMLVVTTIVVSVVKVVVIAGVILLVKWVIRKIKSK